MANSVDPDQRLCSRASGLGLHCLIRPVCPNTKGYYSRCREEKCQYIGCKNVLLNPLKCTSITVVVVKLSMLGKKFSKLHLKYFFLFLPENEIGHLIEDTLHEMSSCIL